MGLDPATFGASSRFRGCSDLAPSVAKLSLAAEEPSPFRSMSMKKVQTWSWCRAHSNKLRDLSSLAAHSPLACHAPIRYGRRVEIQPSPPCKRTSTAAQVTLLALWMVSPAEGNTPFKYCIPQAQTPGLQVHEGQLQHRISSDSELLVPVTSSVEMLMDSRKSHLSGASTRSSTKSSS